MNLHSILKVQTFHIQFKRKHDCYRKHLHAAVPTLGRGMITSTDTSNATSLWFTTCVTKQNAKQNIIFYLSNGLLCSNERANDASWTSSPDNYQVHYVRADQNNQQTRHHVARQATNLLSTRETESWSTYRIEITFHSVTVPTADLTDRGLKLKFFLQPNTVFRTSVHVTSDWWLSVCYVCWLCCLKKIKGQKNDTLFIKHFAGNKNLQKG